MEIKHLALGMVNAYLIKTGDDVFLIDSGLSMNRSKLKKLLSAEGIKPGNIKFIIITHGDIDHIGNCAYFQKSGVKIAIHQDDIEMCRTGKSDSDRKRKGNLFTRLLHKLLFTVVYPPVLRRYPCETFEPDILLSDGQNLKNYGLDASIFHIPGHTKGSIGILTADHDFFSGDTIINRKKPETAYIIDDEMTLKSSIEKIRNLKIRNVYPGHGMPFAMSALEF